MQKIDTRHNKVNEIAKRKFFEQLEHCKDGKDPKTVNQYINAIHEFEIATNFKDFKEFNSDWAIKFKNYLSDKQNKRTKQPISKSLYFHYLSHVREFFEWLAKGKKYYAKIKFQDIEYLHATRNDKNKAKALGYQESHSIADILATIRNMPAINELELRNKAMLSLCILTTPRISALQTARLQSIKYFKNLDVWAFVQDPRLSNTKYSKIITAFFIGQSIDIIENVLAWRKYLMAKGFTDKDYLFPKITPNFTNNYKSIMLLTKDRIKSQSTIRDIFKDAFLLNCLPYYKPHSFRHSIAREMKQGGSAVDRSIALAENLGHKSGLSTLHASYGGNYEKQQADILKGFKLE
jgi:integrase